MGVREEFCPLCPAACLEPKGACLLGKEWSLTKREVVFRGFVKTAGCPPWIGVESDVPLPCSALPLLRRFLKKQVVLPPLLAGEVVVENLWNSGVNLIALEDCYRNAKSGLPPLWRMLSGVKPSPFFVSVCAHRGDVKRKAENTLAAFESAIELEADMIELDVQLTKDGRVVVFHDIYLERVTNGEGRLQDHTLGELRSLEVLEEGGKIPTLEEVFELCQGKVLLLLEIKNPLEENQGIEVPLCELIRRFQMESQVILATRTLEYGCVLKEMLAGVKVLYLIVAAKQIKPALYAPLDGIVPFWRLLDCDIVKRFHELGKMVIPWTVNRPLAMERLVEWEVDAIITDEILLLQEILWKKARISHWNPLYWKVRSLL